MTDLVIWTALNSKNKVSIQYPYTGFLDNSLCEAEIEDIIEFGFSYIEQEDHLIEFIITGPKLLKKIIKEIDDFKFCIEEPYIGTLWTAQIYLTNKLKNNQIVFSSWEFSPVLQLNLNKI